MRKCLNSIKCFWQQKKKFLHFVREKQKPSQCFYRIFRKYLKMYFAKTLLDIRFSYLFSFTLIFGIFINLFRALLLTQSYSLSR